MINVVKLLHQKSEMKNKYLKIGIMLHVLFKVTNDLCCRCLDCCCLIDLLTTPSTLTLEPATVCLLVFYLLVCFGGCFPHSLSAVLTLVRVSLHRTYINILKYPTNIH